VSIRVGDFEVDVALVQEPTFDSDVTSVPVEKGSNITDNQRIYPVELVVEGFVSDTPVGAIADVRGTEGFPSVDAYAYFKTLQEIREPFTVETTTDVFDDMLLKTLSPATSTQNGFRFRAVFTSVIIITNDRTTIEVANPRASKKLKRGSKPIGKGPTIAEVAKARGYDNLQEMFDDEERFNKQNGKYPKIGQLHKSPPLDIFAP
jgi:hypothetical protein